MEEDEKILAQYKEGFEYLRQIERFIWQIPSIITLINGGLVAVVFTYMLNSGPIPRIITLLLALVLTLSICYVHNKHRYFAKIMTGNLSSIEQQLGIKHIQKTASATVKDEFHKKSLYPNGVWASYEPPKLLRFSGERAMRWAMYSMAIFIAWAIIYIRWFEVIQSVD